MARISYTGALSLAEEFTINSGISVFCSEVCRGSCCRGCRRRCPDQGPKRLACALYMCPTIRNCLPLAERRRFDLLYQQVTWDLKKAYRNTHILFLGLHYYPDPDVVIEAFITDSYGLTRVLGTDNASAVKKQLDRLRQAAAGLDVRLPRRYQVITPEYIRGHYWANPITE